MRKHSIFAKKLFLFPLIFLTGTILFAQTTSEDYDDFETLLNSIIEKNQVKTTKTETQAQTGETIQTDIPEDDVIIDDVSQSDITEDDELIEEASQTELPPEEEIPTKEELPTEEKFKTEEEIPSENEFPPEEELSTEEPQVEETPTEEPAAEEPSEPVIPDTEEVEAEDENKHKYEALAMIRYKNTDAITFRLKGSVAPGPYILGASFGAGYISYKLIQPFYFGGFMESHIGFPQKNFPYKYQLHGSDISSPLIVGGKLYIPFGICVYPFQQNIEFFVDLAPGIVMNLLWNTKFGGDSITSRVFTGFYGAIKTGASYKNFSVFLEGNYDAVVGFGVSIGISYSIPVSYTTQIEEAPKSLEDN